MHENVNSILDVSSIGVICISPDDNLGTAVRIMVEQHVSALVIVDVERRPAGIVTSYDVVRSMHAGCSVVSRISDVMSAPVVTITLDTQIIDAYQLCRSKNIRHLIVVDTAGHPAGLLAEQELIGRVIAVPEGNYESLEASFLRTLVDTLPDLVWLKDADGVYLACNRQFEKLYDVKEDDLIGKTDYDFVDKDLADFFRLHDQKAIAASAPSVNEEWLMFARDGYRGLFETIKTPMRDTRGQLIGVLGIARDITPRKRIEDALYFISQKGWAEGTEKFLDALARFLGETLNVDYVIIDRLCDEPEYAETVALYAKGEIIPNLRYHLPGTPCANIVGCTYCCYPENVQQLFPDDELLVSMGVESYAGIPLWNSGGQAIGLIAVLDGRPMQDKNLIEQVLKVVAMRVAAELEREETHRALKQREQEFRTLAEHMPDNMVRYDKQGSIRYMNPAFLASIAPEIRPLSGHTMVEAHPEFSPAHAFQMLLGRVIESGERAEAEMLLPNSVGELRNHFVQLIPECNEDGAAIGVLAIGRDVTEQNRARAQLKKEKQFVDDVINSLPGIFYLLDLQGQFLKVNTHFLEVSGYSFKELEGLSALEFFEGEDRKLIAERIGSVFENGFAWAEAEFCTRSGLKIPYGFSGHLTEIDGVNYLVGLGMDITERKRAEDALRINASVFETSQEAIVISDADNNIIDVNPAFTHITGYKRDEVVGKNPRLLSADLHDNSFYAEMWRALEQNKSWRGEVWNRRQSGELFAELLSISVVQDPQGHTQRYVGVFSDITHLKTHEAELSRVANHDVLTGLPNRRLLADRLAQSIVRAQRSGKMLAVCYLDLDGFKQVNDLFGHEAGDQLLIAISERLQDSLRLDDTVARLGGDEFVILFNELSSKVECYAVLDRMLEAIGRPVLLDAGQAVVSASIGVTFYPDDFEDGDTLLRHADQAMYTAKQSGKNRYHPFDLSSAPRISTDLSRPVLQSLVKGEFELYYQPKVDLDTRVTTGVEALIRWHHPVEGLLLPVSFLHMIESAGVEIQFGEWVMDTALRQLDEWHRAGLRLDMSINISAHHLLSHEFVVNLARRLASYPELPRNVLQIEMLESAILSDIEQTTRTVDACRELGVTFALDDFGTGYSSFTYLRKLSVDVLKIDQSFVTHMMEDEGDQAIVLAIIALAKTFGRKTVAEGVEELPLMQFLQQAGCGSAQGFGIAKPMPDHELRRWLKNV